MSVWQVEFSGQPISDLAEAGALKQRAHKLVHEAEPLTACVHGLVLEVCYFSAFSFVLS